ncbi:MAG: pyridoxamine 5'-phosphate oxidase family protein [Rhodocyclales bacterium]|nr:pyridoxamine 5'-phosphate oxidase family protein [Rhodocyclales bacterium]
MPNDITPTLPQKLVDYLQPGAPALVLTTGADGYPSSAFTWVVCLDRGRLRFGVDHGGSAMANLARSGQASIQVIGPGDLTYLVKGRSRKIKEHIEAAAPASLMLYEMDVMGARDQSWAGVSTMPLAYEWPAAQRAALLAMEQAVYAEMRDFAA